MENILAQAIECAQTSDLVFTKFIKPNDVGNTGGHQAGFHIHKNAWNLFFDTPGDKGTNKDVFVTIKWQNTFETNSRFIYYGAKTRNEYRLTRFGKNFPFLQDENIGDLLVICKIQKEYYHAFVLQSESDIEDFFAALNISSEQTNSIISKSNESKPEDQLYSCLFGLLKTLAVEFPPTHQLASDSRNCYNSSHKITKELIRKNPDEIILSWLNAEFYYFKLIENLRYDKIIKRTFPSVEALIETANTILNRRKSRAGKSLEHHLSEIFTINRLLFGTQISTEDNKRPDFLFPGESEYKNSKFSQENLVMLAAKTTCKDRWRQILNEADRIKTKHLFTLQQGISTNQLKEMYKHHVQLVVPANNIGSFPKEFQPKIQSLNSFIQFVNRTQKK